MGAEITLSRKGKEIATIAREVDEKNEIELQIYSSKMEYGDYSVFIRLFSDAYKSLGKVYTSSSDITFKFGYIQAPVKIEHTKEKTATQFTDLGNEVDARIENILKEKISGNGIPIEIADSSNSNSQFTVQIKFTKLKAAEGVHKIKVTATVLFERDGVTLAKGSEISAIGLSKASEEMAMESAFEQVCNLLEEDETLYQNLLKSVGGKRE